MVFLKSISSLPPSKATARGDFSASLKAAAIDGASSLTPAEVRKLLPIYDKLEALLSGAKKFNNAEAKRIVQNYADAAFSKRRFMTETDFKYEAYGRPPYVELKVPDLGFFSSADRGTRKGKADGKISKQNMIDYLLIRVALINDNVFDDQMSDCIDELNKRLYDQAGQSLEKVYRFVRGIAAGTNTINGLRNENARKLDFSDINSVFIERQTELMSSFIIFEYDMSARSCDLSTDKIVMKWLQHRIALEDEETTTESDETPPEETPPLENSDDEPMTEPDDATVQPVEEPEPVDEVDDIDEQLADKVQLIELRVFLIGNGYNSASELRAEILNKAREICPTISPQSFYCLALQAPGNTDIMANAMSYHIQQELDKYFAPKIYAMYLLGK